MPAFETMGIHVPELLLPEDPNSPVWPCVACDQYTSQPEVWREMEALVGEKPSALRLILPEAFLSETEARLPGVLRAMEEYLSTVLTRRLNGFVLTRRTTESGSRLGLVLAVDLEAYDFSPGSVSPIRATEGTILERLPPRIRVRERAALECSHILLLANDVKDLLLGPLYARLQTEKPIYDLELPLGGGHLTGWAVTGEMLAQAERALSALWEQKGGDPFLAVGDGNHSLATAKAIWQGLKGNVPEDHPARYAMCELTNLHDPALVFEPIHRCLFGLREEQLLSALSKYPSREADKQTRPGTDGMLYVGPSRTLLYQNLPLKELQAALDGLVGTAFASLDYVHGDEAALAAGSGPDSAALLLPAMDKRALFPSIAGGPLPRKAFSMGHANEKRYYMECRRIRP